MRYLMGMIAAAALAATPAMAQDNTAAAVPDAGNTLDPSAAPPAAADPMMNGLVAEPLPADTAAPAATPATRPARKESFPWGILGVLGLAGLLGRMRR